MDSSTRDLAENTDLEAQEHARRIERDPFCYESYHALFELHQAAGRTDAAYCVAHALSFLKQATPAQQAFVDRHRPDGMVRARRRLPEGTLRYHVAHPDQDLLLTCIFGVIAPAVAAWRAVNLPGSLNARDRVDVTVEPSLFSRMTHYVGIVLDVCQPDVYLRPSDMGDLSLMNIARRGGLRPTMVVFGNLLRGKAEPHLAFALGRYMMDLYPPHFCLVALDRSPQAMKQVLLACLHRVGLLVQGGDRAALEQISREIFGRMTPGDREVLCDLLARFVKTGTPIDTALIQRWVRGTELTAHRVGLLLSADLRVAGQMLAQEQAPLGMEGMMTPREKIQALVLYSVSEDYFAARRALGVDVGEGPIPGSTAGRRPGVPEVRRAG